jgi:hypothetical protein
VRAIADRSTSALPRPSFIPNRHGVSDERGRKDVSIKNFRGSAAFICDELSCRDVAVAVGRIFLPGAQVEQQRGGDANRILARGRFSVPSG